MDEILLKKGEDVRRRVLQRLTSQCGKRREFVGRLLRADVDDARVRRGCDARLLFDRREDFSERLVGDR